MRSTDTDILVVGAGPAGLAAAIELAEHGENCLVLDENPSIGGAVYRQGLKHVRNAPPLPPEAQELFAAFQSCSDRIALSLSTQVVGAEGSSLICLDEDGLRRIFYRRLIVCSGCYETVWPFPGWTLPGVMTVGGLQLQVKREFVRPGKKAVLVGTGPLLLTAACQLLDAGVAVAGVFEAGRRRHLLANFPKLVSNMPLLLEGIALLLRLRKAGVEVRYGHGIVEACGERELSEVVLAPYDGDWRPKRNKSFVVKADLLGFGYGYQSRIQIPRLLGCLHKNGSTVTDEWGRTSLENVYVAGDARAVFGRQVAREQGRLAALACLGDMGRQSSGEERPVLRKIARLLKFQKAFRKFSKVRPGLASLPDEDTIVCRCEQVRFQEVRKSVERGARTLPDLKLATRVGMGDCQGKVCGAFCSQYLSLQGGLSPDEIGDLPPRFPLEPVPMDAFLEKGAGHAK